ncbi:hypothetical protein ABT084_12965 [Streptomyces sp. NPDC002138]|uniref:hypothetical protein n=1 Tax=Streptomyces sp. NPDC002138 TaxID=3154410 RepID=UPI00332E7664
MILQETLAAVQPGLSWNHGPSGNSRCEGAGSPAGSASARRSITVLTIVSEARRGALIGVIEREWKGRGYTITKVRPGRETPAVYAATPENYRLSAMVGSTGQFFFDITTPCFADSPVQDPTAKPNTPVRTGPYPQRPDVHDDFWSAESPAP